MMSCRCSSKRSSSRRICSSPWAINHLGVAAVDGRATLALALRASSCARSCAPWVCTDARVNFSLSTYGRSRDE